MDFNILADPGFVNSPLRIVFTEGAEVRGWPEDLESGRFSIFDDLRAGGVTDYIALPLHFTDGLSHASSWTTKQPRRVHRSATDGAARAGARTGAGH